MSKKIFTEKKVKVLFLVTLMLVQTIQSGSDEETLDFISQFIIETEDVLKNSIIVKTYTEELVNIEELQQWLLKSSEFIIK